MRRSVNPDRRYSISYAAFFTVLLLAIYLAYVVFVIGIDQGPVDYETFMRIGGQFNRGEEIYGENSYYPLPYVMIFGSFLCLSRSASAGWQYY